MIKPTLRPVWSQLTGACKSRFATQKSKLMRSLKHARQNLYLVTQEIGETIDIRVERPSAGNPGKVDYLGRCIVEFGKADAFNEQDEGELDCRCAGPQPGLGGFDIRDVWQVVADMHAGNSM
jgi:hypothetical protein